MILSQRLKIFLFALLAFSLSCSPGEIKYKDSYLARQKEFWLSKAYRYEQNGWIFVHIEGKPFERGFQRGFLTANEIDEFYKTLAYVQEHETGEEIDYFVKASKKLFTGKVSPEYVEEIQGMAAGARAAGKNITDDQMLLMNGFIDIAWYWWPKEKQRLRNDGPGCSAFIASGDATTDGSIVMAHNSWASYSMLRFCNIVVDITPDKGNRILMQSWGPCIYSATDFFITSVGLMGTETTIGAFQGYNPKGKPVFERARYAMQYASDINEWADILIKDNSGAYANSWLIGDTKTGEIARLELGLKNHNLEKKKNGYFAGSNVAENIKLLRQETNANNVDIRNSAVARHIRWEQLLSESNGKIDIEAAKKMLADHYDVYLKKENPSSRTICGHYEFEDGSVPTSPSPFLPSGAGDGKVIDSNMAGAWQFLAKWGSSCDRNFDANNFLAQHPQYNWQKGYLVDLPNQPWITVPEKH